MDDRPVGSSNDVTALARDLAGNIWVGYETTRTNGEPVSGLSRFDGQSWQHYTIARDVLGNAVRTMAVDPAVSGLVRAMAAK